MWEDALAQRLEGESVNALFVRMALQCHATIALFKTRLGAGTREEVEALLALPPEHRKPLSIVRFALEDGEEPTEDPSPLDEFLAGIGTGEKVLYASTGPIGSDDAYLKLTHILTGFTLAALDAGIEERTDAP
ncbi:MAG: hypothetical protein QOJ38_2010 [Solirubrobacterales bacterium]|jgi:hypothetical protein|nr:hypothetical protein [Solirubrobacterales bacterium]